LFFLTVSVADNEGFIFPKKKNIIINTEKKQVRSNKNTQSKSFNLPKKKPIKREFSSNKNQVKTEKNSTQTKKKEVSIKLQNKHLPVKKPSFKNNISKEEDATPYLEVETQEKISELKKKLLSKSSKEIIKSKNIFLFPIKKPLNYSKVSTKVESKSKILKEKDYLKAKNIFNLIKKGKWIAALQQTKKVKDTEFKSLVTWLYLKERGNQATFNDYKNFIADNPDYPRIGRLRYMAEHKIIMDNTTPKIIISLLHGTER